MLVNGNPNTHILDMTNYILIRLDPLHTENFFFTFSFYFYNFRVYISTLCITHHVPNIIQEFLRYPTMATIFVVVVLLLNQLSLDKIIKYYMLVSPSLQIHPL